ncbi:hypothetical protein J2X61_001383 [Bacillus sp. 3255]|nr:hypothetical protein [Bacillus sp. 3255]
MVYLKRCMGKNRPIKHGNRFHIFLFLVAHSNRKASIVVKMAKIQWMSLFTHAIIATLNSFPSARFLRVCVKMQKKGLQRQPLSFFQYLVRLVL